MSKKVKVPSSPPSPDITERKRVEEALQESEERYHALVNLGAEVGEAVIMMQDTEQGNGIQTFVSDAWSRITGYSERELLGMSFFDLTHPKDREASLERHYRKMRGEAMPGLFELSIVRKDGIEVPIELTSAYTMYKGERANVAYIRDITERKRMEHDLKERVKELQCLYSIAYIAERPGITLDEVCQEVVNLLPAGWQQIHHFLTLFKRNRGERELRFWSTACAWGEEPYSIAILLADFLGNRRKDFDISIYATDISQQALQEAQAGVYSSKDVEGLTPTVLEHCFTRYDKGYVVNSNIRQMLLFSYFDLTSPARQPFVNLDCVFCCNVLIYLQPRLQERVLSMLYDSLAAPGYLILGEVETPTNDLRDKLECLDATAKIYKKNERR